ncbi:DnaJ-domain-containing protein [Trematosphaeria pertusa]|uniref:DnaJ-domain-containing protein n=1 Tax=Trematosphaeria pertusa TaxID=390896 RepID=A0A6A6IHB0_9PLEO|nr:DnaJ-domain-containing protein [Trematosphaeria pertusa]KAF2249557.1 DnaJ-domain-containing protein [Trematosphaeria pertusa]
MESTLPPDPYKALGVAKDADTATIKATYRKLVLKCHPDKVTDESLKKLKQEEFHKIQEAYEIIGDEEKRARHDAEVKLEQLRKDNLARKGGAPNVEVRTGRYEVRTQAPAGATFTATTPHRYEQHKPSSRSYDDRERDRYYEERSRNSSSRPSRSEKEPPVRAARKKSRDKEERKDRGRRFVSARYEAAYRRRDEEEEARRQAAEARRKADESRRSYEDARYDRERKTSELTSNAVHYIHRSKADADARPSPSRTTSSRDVRPEYFESRSRRERPEAVRRSSARPKESGRERDRKGIEIVDWDDDRVPKIPSFKHASSSPAELHVPRATPQRSYTESSRDHRRTETSPTPLLRRETAPVSSSSRRKEAAVPRPSGLRESTTPHDSGASSPETYPTVPPAQSSSTKKYYYPTPGGGVRLTPEDVGVANGHRTVLHEPGRHRTRSPSPLSRPPMGANRPVETASATYTTAAPKASVPPPPLSRAATMNVSPIRGSDDRGRRLYGELNSDYLRRENARRQTSFSPEKVSYTPKIGPEDIRWSAQRGRDPLERDREYAKPTLGRHATYVY